MSDQHQRALLRDFPAADARHLFHQVLDLGLDFASGSVRDDLVLRYAAPRELIEGLSGPLPLEGISEEQLLDALRDVASWSISQADARYLAFPDTGDSAAGVAAEILAAFLNQNVIAFDRSAPAASVIEAQLIAWLRELIGYGTTPLAQYGGLSTIGGMWTSGGNMSNHVAMTAALAAAYPQIRETGMHDLPERPAVLLAHGVEHFSYVGAAQVLGLGSKGLIWADPTPRYTSDVDSIARLLKQPPDGSRIVMVVGVAGNCRTTGIDDLAALADLCQQYDVWFHVDACHGGSLLFSERLRHQLAGIEYADSVSLDPHKGLFVTYPSSYVLFKAPGNLARFARYPDRADDPECLDLGLITPFYGSRGFESLKLWALIRHLGRSGIGRLVEERQRTYQDMVEILERAECFQILGTSDFYRCAFVFLPTPVAEAIDAFRQPPHLRPALRSLISRFTSLYADRLYRSGHAAFDLFALQDLADTIGLGSTEKYEVMGMCVGHPHIDAATRNGIEKHLTALRDELAGHMLAAVHELSTSGTDTASPRQASGPAGW